MSLTRETIMWVVAGLVVFGLGAVWWSTRGLHHKVDRVHDRIDGVPGSKVDELQQNIEGLRQQMSVANDEKISLLKSIMGQLTRLLDRFGFLRKP